MVHWLAYLGGVLVRHGDCRVLTHQLLDIKSWFVSNLISLKAMFTSTLRMDQKCPLFQVSGSVVPEQNPVYAPGRLASPHLPTDHLRLQSIPTGSILCSHPTICPAMMYLGTMHPRTQGPFHPIRIFFQ